MSHTRRDQVPLQTTSECTIVNTYEFVLTMIWVSMVLATLLFFIYQLW